MDKTLEIIIISLLLTILAEVYILTRPKKRLQTNEISTLVDTSVLMDGRVVDLARTGFLQGQVIVPKSVLLELQLLADGSDHDKRERARLGMDAVKELKDILGVSFTLLQDGKDRAGRGVDEQLIYLGKQTDSAVLTLDYNLNKVAQVEGVQVLNINELAKSLRMVHLPGDNVQIELTQKGQSPDQAVGYLADGTMVVVEQAKQWIGKTKSVEIVRSLQTDAGKMMFAKVVDATASSRKSVRVSTQGRRATESQKGSSIKSKTDQQHKGSGASGSQRGGRPSPRPRQSSSTQGGALGKVRKAQRSASQSEADLVRLANKGS